jgi:hypothetical protein
VGAREGREIEKGRKSHLSQRNQKKKKKKKKNLSILCRGEGGAFFLPSSSYLTYSLLASACSKLLSFHTLGLNTFLSFQIHGKLD